MTVAKDPSQSSKQVAELKEEIQRINKCYDMYITDLKQSNELENKQLKAQLAKYQQQQEDWTKIYETNKVLRETKQCQQNEISALRAKIEYLEKGAKEESTGAQKKLNNNISQQPTQ